MPDPEDVTHRSEEWRRALAVADSVRHACHELELAPNREWVRQVMNEAAEQMRSAVLWAASQEVSREAHEGARPYIIAADATRSDAAMVSYFLNFLRNENLVNAGVAQEMGAQLQEIERGMDSLSRNLRRELGFDPYEDRVN